MGELDDVRRSLLRRIVEVWGVRVVATGVALLVGPCLCEQVDVGGAGQLVYDDVSVAPVGAPERLVAQELL